MAHQTLTLELDEITAGDYLQWIRDPEPPALDAGLRSVRLEADPLGETITARLDWAGPAPPARSAAAAAGLPLVDGVRLGVSASGGRRPATAGSRRPPWSCCYGPASSKRGFARPPHRPAPGGKEPLSTCGRPERLRGAARGT